MTKISSIMTGDVGKFERYVIREPNDKELKKFKSKFFAKKRRDEFENKLRQEYKDGFSHLLQIIGQQQSDYHELKDLLTEIMNDWIWLHKTNPPVHINKKLQYVHKLIGESLFYEMKLGLW